MKKLLPISKLYNFNAKVFKNYIFLASKLIFLTSIFFLIPIKSVEANVDETGILRLEDEDGTQAEVYFFGNKAGEGTIIKDDCPAGADWFFGNYTCWYNGIRNLNNNAIYNKDTKKFGDVPSIYQSTAGLPMEQVAKKGFCAGVRGLKGGKNRVPFEENTKGPLNYIKFKLNEGGVCTEKISVQWRSNILYYEYFREGCGDNSKGGFNFAEAYTEVPLGQTCPGTLNNMRIPPLNPAFVSSEVACTPNIFNDGKGITLYSITNCNNNIHSDNQRWVTKNGWFSTCKAAYGSINSNTAEVEATCKYYVCEKYSWLKDSNTDITCGECEYRNMLAANPEEALSSCTFDKNTSTGSTNCYSEKKYITSTFDQPILQNKNFFCAPNNKVAVCDKSLDTYDKVFNPKLVGGTPPRQSGVLNTLKDPEKCKFYEDLIDAPEADCPVTVAPGQVVNCDLPSPEDGQDPISCCFGTLSQTCGTTTGARSTSPVSKESADKPGSKLYCASDNKVIRCPGPARRFITNPGTGGAPEEKGVMRTSTNLTSGNKYPDCEVVTEMSLNSCNIDKRSTTCNFGDRLTDDNCYDQKIVAPKGSMNLFCDKDGKVTACPESITTYQQAFPGIPDKNGPYRPDPSCREYDESMTDIVTPPEEDCTTDDEGEMFFLEEKITDSQTTAYKECLVDRAGRVPEKPDLIAQGCRVSTFGSEAINQTSFKQCLCDVSYNPQYDFFWCNMWPDENKCKKFCKLFESEFGAVGIMKVQEAVSPLNLIKTISDFLFAFAVLIFIINMLRASLLYVTSGGDESKMKEAQSTATNTVFGMIFIVFIGALIRWVIGSTGTFINE